MCIQQFDMVHSLFSGDNLLQETIIADNGLNSWQWCCWYSVQNYWELLHKNHALFVPPLFGHFKYVSVSPFFFVIFQLFSLSFGRSIQANCCRASDSWVFFSLECLIKIVSSLPLCLRVCVCIQCFRNTCTFVFSLLEAALVEKRHTYALSVSVL